MRLTALLPTLHRPLVIGMLHVPALPGSPNSAGELAATRHRVLEDAGVLAAAGFDALMLENFGDLPFFPGRVPHETVAYLTMLACAVKSAHPQIPLGINVLRNDGQSAIAVAHASAADFIRVNVLCGARVTDQGVLQATAHEVLRLRKNLAAQHLEIFADVDVKHSASLGAGRPIEVEIEDLVQRGFADALIVSGTGTGKATDPRKLAVVKAAAAKGRHPEPGTFAARIAVFVGSGVSAETVAELATADGFIVGTSLKQDGTGPAGPVDEAKARRFMQAVRQLAPGSHEERP